MVSDKVSTLSRAGEGADRLFLPADLAAAASEVDVHRADLAVHVGRGDAERHQAVGIELDADFARDAADALDPADALQTLQRRLTTSSTYQDSCSSVMPGEEAA